MNDLKRILKNAQDLGLNVEFDSTDTTNLHKMITLVEVREEGWEIIFDITPDSCNFREHDYEVSAKAISEETVPTFEEAFELAKGWC